LAGASTLATSGKVAHDATAHVRVSTNIHFPLRVLLMSIP
jgi:hypothetical protein